MNIVFTIGHSTRTIDEFIKLLNKNKIKLLADVRTIPKSLNNPQYQQEELKRSLENAGINYKHYKDLGGLRPKAKTSTNLAWQNQSFRNYADYMQTENFKLALKELIAESKDVVTAIMCAEAVPWRCHRRLIADALIVNKFKVIDIISEINVKEHKLTEFAKIEGENIIYP